MSDSPASHRTRSVLLLGTLSAFGPLSMDLYLPALPTMQAQLHTSTSLAQLTITACTLGMAFGQLLIGPLSDRFGRRLPLQAGLWLFTVTSLLIAVVPNIWLMIGLRLLQCVGGAAGQVLSRSIARDLYHGVALTRFLAILMGINGLFPIISPSIGSLVLMATVWQGIFILLAVIGALLIIMSLWWLPETLPRRQRSVSIAGSFKQMGQLLKNRRFMTFVLAQGFAYGALFSYISGSTFVYQGYYHVPVWLFALLYAFIGLGIIAGTNLVNRLVEVFATQRLFFIGLIGGIGAGIVLLVNALVVDQLWLLIAGCFTMQIFFAMVNATATSLGMNVDDKRAGGASALLGLGSNAIGGLFSPLVGLFAATNSLPMAGLITFASGIAFLIAGIGLHPHRAV